MENAYQNLKPEHIIRLFNSYAHSCDVLLHCSEGRTKTAKLEGASFNPGRGILIITPEGNYSMEVFKPKMILSGDIRDKDAIELAKIYDGNIHGDGDDNELIRAGKETAARILEGYFNTVQSMKFVFANEFLKLRGYAVPWFFDVNHPDNGKTPVDLKLAIIQP